MNGLFRNNFYEAWNNLKLFGAFIFLLGIVVVYLGNDTLLELFPYITISSFAVSGIATLRKDTVSQWNIYELTLPVTRRDLISSKYISYLFWTLAGLLVSALVVSLTFVIHGNLFAYGIRDCFSLFSLGTGLAVTAGAIFYPLAIVCGADKSEVFLAISVVLSICISAAMISAVNMFDFNNTVRLSMFNLAYLLLFALSYVLSNMLYAHKEL